VFVGHVVSVSKPHVTNERTSGNSLICRVGNCSNGA
jgi:hypothetical protein